MRLGTTTVSLVLAAFLVTPGCTTTTPAPKEPVAAAPAVPQRMYYTLRADEPVAAGFQLPTRTDVYVDWHYDDGSVRPYKGFRGWDFGGDGHFGMLEVFDESGLTQHYLFDFLGDGHPQFSVDADDL